VYKSGCTYLIEVIHKYAIVDREVYGPIANVCADRINSLELSDPAKKNGCVTSRSKRLWPSVRLFETNTGYIWVDSRD